MLLLIFVLAIDSSHAQEDEPFIQANVYNALFEAYVQCNDGFDQSRSEFITEKLEQSSGEISIATLRKIVNYNVQVASAAIAQKSSDRELYVAEILGAHNKSTDQPIDPADGDKEPHREVREIDDFLKEKTRYVEVHECVLEVL